MKRTTKRLCYLAVLTAVALTIFVIEAQIPLIAPVPGMKLGLANIITVYAMFRLGPRDTLLILVARILLGSMFAGGFSAMLYSLAGGLMCYLAMLFLRRFLKENQIWVAGIVGALFHNVGQVLVAILMVGSWRIAFYLPFLLAVSILTGAFTGLCAQVLNRRLRRISFQG
ncbi:MAG: Gx transporter family protein [Oscillospiraceae bacterium]|nr:Gx transporter family protein [Oscillospiraceae bacterium]